MMKEVVIKEIGIVEATKYRRQICKVMAESHKVNFIDSDFFDSNARFEKMCDYMRLGKARVAIALEKDEFCGYMWFFCVSENRFHLNEIAVTYEKRGNHIGSKLVEYLEGLAKKSDVREIELFCMESNEAAKSFYSSKEYTTEKRLMVKRL